MAESIIAKKVCPAPCPNRMQATTITVDISKYKDGGSAADSNFTSGFAFLVAARSWAGTGFTAVGSLYLVSGIQNGNFQSCVAIKREGTYAPTITLSGYTLTIKYINNLGGHYSIIPIYNIP